MKRLLIFFLLATAANAGPKHFVKSVGFQFKRTFYTDVKTHPLSWGVPLALQFAIVFSDAGSSCALPERMQETGLSRYFVGRYPKCHKYVVWTAASMTAHATAENWLANKFTDACLTDAVDRGSTWWKVQAHTHDPSDCYKWVPIAHTIAIGAREIPAIKGNIDLLQK